MNDSHLGIDVSKLKLEVALLTLVASFCASIDFEVPTDYLLRLDEVSVSSK